LDRSRLRDLPFHYGVYGIGIDSDFPLPLPPGDPGPLCRIACVEGAPSAFAAARVRAVQDSAAGAWYRRAVLDEGSIYVGWEAIGEFLVDATGHEIVARRDDGCATESFLVYMLGQALSFALVRQNLEPLHATSVVVGGRAIAFLGNPAFGKSTLAASFLEEGHRLLTDDLLVLNDLPDPLVAYPGPPRIKLFPAIARRYLDDLSNGVPMNADTQKLIVPLDDRRWCASPMPLTTIYVIREPWALSRSAAKTSRSETEIEHLNPRDAFLALLGGVFNRRVPGKDRLARQFAFLSGLVARVPVRRLSYPRALERIGEVRRAILDDLDSPCVEATAGVVTGALEVMV
jgi:hypothetical protein